MKVKPDLQVHSTSTQILVYCFTAIVVKSALFYQQAKIKVAARVHATTTALNLNGVASSHLHLQAYSSSVTSNQNSRQGL